MEKPPGEVTRLLKQFGGNAREASPQLVQLVYKELRRLAGGFLRRERPGHSMQATELVHEAYMRLVEQREVTWKDRAHFFAIAAQVMRRILTDEARSRLAAKRGGGNRKIPLDESSASSEQRSETLLSLDAALSKLAIQDPRQSQVVELRYYGGLSTEDIAEVLGIAPRTVERDWKVAQAWLRREMGGAPQ
jgi:RNA polymerase sigma-70 factor, ECF subfamily